MKKTLLKTFYNLGGFAPFHRVNRGKVLILMYHRFSREKNPSKISGGEFAAHLAYLGKYNRVLSLAETIEFLKEGKTLPSNAAVITIDDGYADVYEIAFPILKRFKMPATLFAVTDFLDGKCWLWTDLMRYVLRETNQDFLSVECENEEKIETRFSSETQKTELANRINSRLKKMTNEKRDAKIAEIAENLNVEIPNLPTTDFAPVSWEQAQEMDAENLSIESHTVTHPILTNINKTELDFELRESKKRLKEKLNREIKFFCYPNGSLNETVWQSVKSNNYKCAVTTAYGFNEQVENPFLLKRIDAHAAIENFAQSVSGFEALRQRN